MDIRFHGQSCFELSEGDTRLLLDPFLKPNNPAAVATADEVDATHIAVTHGHVDHCADVVPIAQRTGAPVVAVVELANWFGEQGVPEVHDPNYGGTVEFDWGSIKLVPAWHTNTAPGSAEAPYSPTKGTVIGPACGLVVKIGGQTIYHAGDTCMFADMRMIGEHNVVDIAMLPIGGHYTMDRFDAVAAAEMIGAGTVIPMHYNTFPPIETDAHAFKSEVESSTSAKVIVLEPGETHSV
jgi:L-ascorbate metabolism protein UlaG (beta-lactamase superfamily)